MDESWFFFSLSSFSFFFPSFLAIMSLRNFRYKSQMSRAYWQIHRRRRRIHSVTPAITWPTGIVVRRQ